MSSVITSGDLNWRQKRELQPRKSACMGSISFLMEQPSSFLPSFSMMPSGEVSARHYKVAWQLGSFAVDMFLASLINNVLGELVPELCAHAPHKWFGS